MIVLHLIDLAEMLSGIIVGQLLWQYVRERRYSVAIERSWWSAIALLGVVIAGWQR